MQLVPNSQVSTSSPKFPLGSITTQQLLLRAANYPVVLLPECEWEDMGSEAKLRWLRARLQVHCLVTQLVEHVA